MKRILAVVMNFIILILFTTACSDLGITESEESRARRERQEKEQRQKDLQLTVNSVAGDILYIKDPRTDICFAYCWHGFNNGGPALATVPCEAIPPELLIVALKD